MEKMIKRLTVANIKGTGIERAERYDFEDDGNYFRGFIYKGMPITQLYWKGEETVYLTIRPDYLERDYTYEEARKAGLYEVTDEFNGYSGEFDLYELINNLEETIRIHNELNSKEDDIDITPIKNAIYEEVEYAEGVLEEASKVNLFTSTASKYEIERFVNSGRDLIKSIQKVKDICVNLDKVERVKKQQYIESLNNYGHIFFSKTTYSIENLLDVINKK